MARGKAKAAKPIRRFDWVRDKPDHRDIICGLAKKKKRGVDPENTDLRMTGFMPPVYDQGNTSSCTANALAAALEYGRTKEGLKPDFVPSRLFIYFNERSLEGDTGEDGGAQIRDGIKALAKWGAADEKLWPFDESKIETVPSKDAYAQATRNIIKKYERVRVRLEDVQNVLTHGIPVVFGTEVYSNFEDTGRDGNVAMPAGEDQGGHALLIVGSTGDKFIVRNSWGADWGDKGYCYMPHEYVLHPSLSSDFWAIFTA